MLVELTRMTAVAALLASLAGCGGDEPSASPAQRAAPAPVPKTIAVTEAVAAHADADGAWLLDYGGRLTRVHADGRVGRRVDATGDRHARDLDVFALDGGTLWVSEEGAGLRRFDAATGRRQGRPLRVGRQPAALELTDGALFVGDAHDGAVRRVDLDARRVVASRRAGERIRALALAGDVVWAVDETAGVVHRLRADDLRPAAAPLEAEGTRPFHVTVAAGAVWVSDEDGVTAYAPQDGRRLGRYAPGVASAPMVAGDDREAWVAGATIGEVQRLDPRSARPIAPAVPAPGGAVAVGANAVWVVSEAGVTRVDR